MYHDEILDRRDADSPVESVILDLEDPHRARAIATSVARRPGQITVRLDRVPARLHPDHREILWEIALRARLVTVPTRCALARVLASGVVHPASVGVVPLATRADALMVGHEPLPGPGPLVMTPATCRDDENLDEVLGAVAALARQGIAMRYVAVPDPATSTGPSCERAEHRFRTAVAAHGLTDRARWSRHDPLAVMSAAQVVVLPWSDDDLVASQSLVDALHLGVPVLAAAFPHAVEAAATGAVHLVRTRSGPSLERGLYRLVTRPMLRTAMRHAARVHRLGPNTGPSRADIIALDPSPAAV